MSNVEVTPDALRAYGNTAAGISAELAGAGSFDLAANIAAMVPVFGLIGQDFLAAFGVAQANHAANITDLATNFGNRAQMAHHSAQAYENHDASLSKALKAVNTQIGGQA